MPSERTQPEQRGSWQATHSLWQLLPGEIDLLDTNGVMRRPEAEQQLRK